jgi:hypothetical protein
MRASWKIYDIVVREQESQRLSATVNSNDNLNWVIVVVQVSINLTSMPITILVQHNSH